MNQQPAPDHGHLPSSTTKTEPMSEVSDSDTFDDDEDDVGDIGADFANEIAAQLASAGPTGMAAAAAISSTKKRKRQHAFETNPSIRKRQQTRLLRKLRQNIEEYSLRVGQQAVVLVATPGKSANGFRSFGAKPLEDVVKNLRAVIMAELEAALAAAAPPRPLEDPTRHEMPPLVIDGIPTPVEKMTQAQLRAFIPLMLKYSTGRGKPGWGKDNTKPVWWPKGVPWANVRMDARDNEDKQKVSWTHALRQIVVNCYKYHGREDLLPIFNEEESESPTLLPTDKKHETGGQPASAVANAAGQYSPAAAATVVQTLSNPDGTISIIHVDPSNPVITLPDGTTAQVAPFDAGQPGVHTLAEVASQQQHHAIEVDPHADLPDGSHIIITGDDGQAYPVSGMITVPVSAGAYQAVMAGLGGGADPPTVQVLGTPVQLAGGGQILAKVESPGEQLVDRHAGGSLASLVTKVMGQHSVHNNNNNAAESRPAATLTITPVCSTPNQVVHVVSPSRLRSVMAKGGHHHHHHQPDTTDKV